MSEQGDNKAWGVVLLVVVTALWGSTFVVIKDAVEAISPSTVLAVRFGIGALLFLPWLRRDKILWRGGLELSVWLWIGYAAQTIGLMTTTPSRSAFITALNVVMVPIILGFLGRKLRWPVWVSAALALLGVGLLSYEGGEPVVGDLWTVATAVSYAIYLVRVEAYARKCDPLPLTAVQMFGIFVLSAVWSGVEGDFNLGAVPWMEMIYLGTAATAICIWLQMKAQRVVSAPRAAVIFTLEPVWAALFSWIWFDDVLATQGWIGAGLILGAMLLGQAPDPKERALP